MYRAMLLLATFASLRFGELVALHHSDLDLDHCAVRVVRVGYAGRTSLVAVADAGRSGLHLNDLCHTGKTMAAATGASLRELMERMGHSSSRAALIYQPRLVTGDEAIAAALGDSLVPS